MDNSSAGNRKELEQRISTASWGVMLIWVGSVYLVEAEVGLGLIGVGTVALLVQAVRVIIGFNLERVWVITGIVCALGGTWELYHSRVPLVPVFLIAIGIVLLLPIITGRQIFKRKKP